MKRRFALSLVVGLLASPLVGSSASAGPPNTPVPPRAAAGMIVGIDQETGRLGMPSEDQLARLRALRQAQPARIATRPAPVYHSNGSVSLDVRSWMREHSWIRIAADGRAVMGCLDTRDQAVRAMKTPVPATEER